MQIIGLISFIILILIFIGAIVGLFVIYGAKNGGIVLGAIAVIVTFTLLLWFAARYFTGF